MCTEFVSLVIYCPQLLKIYWESLSCNLYWVILNGDEVLIEDGVFIKTFGFNKKFIDFSSSILLVYNFTADFSELFFRIYLTVRYYFGQSFTILWLKSCMQFSEDFFLNLMKHFKIEINFGQFWSFWIYLFKSYCIEAQYNVFFNDIYFRNSIFMFSKLLFTFR